MANRIEGQVWLSRDDPCVMKYYAQGDEYWLQAAATYTANTQIYKGQVLAPDPAGNGFVRPAVFPRDIDCVLGVALNDAAPTFLVRIVNYGYLKLSRAEALNCFATLSDLNRGAIASDSYYIAQNYKAGCGGNGWASMSSGYGLGKPIYWYIGRTYKTAANTYEYTDSSTVGYEGRLTVATPSGYKPTGAEIPWNDASLNCCYKDCPAVGSVVGYSYSGSDITEIIIHINFSQFKKRIQFVYPAKDLMQYLAIDDPKTLTIRHGLFPNNTSTPHVEVSAWGYTDSNVESSAAGESFALRPGYDSYIGPAVDKRTEVEICSDTGFYYKISGDVNYNY